MTGLIACLIMLTFLFQVGLINYIAKDYPYSYSLDLDRKLATNDRSIRYVTHTLYFTDSEVTGTRWLFNGGNSTYDIYSDMNSMITLLISYGRITPSRFLSLMNYTRFTPKSYVYLKSLNIQAGIITLSNSQFNTTALTTQINNSNKIYSNYNIYIYINP
jgi:uncharacterized membrane protein